MYKTIKEKVREIQSLPFVAGEFPVPVEAIAEHLGFGCYFFEPDEQTMDISGVVNHKSRKIFVNKNDLPQRQLFTVAHEIGHIMMHGVDEDYVDYRAPTLMDDSNREKEAEANYFAAELLMPEEFFKFQWKSFKSNINKVANFFGVSPSAVGVRANALGLD